MAQVGDALSQGAQADDGLSQRRLARTVGSEQGDLLATFDHHIDAAHERFGGRARTDAHRRRLHLEHDAGRRRRLRQSQVQPASVASRRLHVALDALDLGELRLGLLGLELLGMEPVVEALELLDLLFVLVVAAGDEIVAGGALAHVGREVAAHRCHDTVLERQHA